MYEKNLLFRTHPRGLVYAAVFSVVLIGHVKTHVGTQAIPPPPTPLFVSSPLSGVQEDRGGRGRSRCWSSPASWSPTAFSHGSDPPYMPVAPGISDGPPFYREHAPVGALETETSPPLEQRGLGGGGLQGEGLGLVGGEGGGGLGREKHLWLENTSSPGKKFNGPLHLVPPTFLP